MCVCAKFNDVQYLTDILGPKWWKNMEIDAAETKMSCSLDLALSDKFTFFKLNSPSLKCKLSVIYLQSPSTDLINFLSPQTFPLLSLRKKKPVFTRCVVLPVTSKLTLMGKINALTLKFIKEVIVNECARSESFKDFCWLTSWSKIFSRTWNRCLGRSEQLCCLIMLTSIQICNIKTVSGLPLWRQVWPNILSI